MLVTASTRSRLPLLDAVAAAVAGGANVVQVREPDLAPADLHALVQAVRDRVAGRALVLVNGDVEQATRAGADGVHLPERLAQTAHYEQARVADLLVGQSVHSVAAAFAAEAAGAHYMQVGAVFATASHLGQPPAGLELLSAVRAAVRLPVIAVGGIIAARTAAVMRAGANGVAVIEALLGSADPCQAAAAIRAALLAQGVTPIDGGAHKYRRESVEVVETFEVVVNGKPQAVPSGASLSALLAAREINPRLTAILRNGEVIQRENYPQTQLQSGDRLEIVTLVGGG